jgi:Endonuclease/Exonuclease/phosphatase family
MRIATYNVNGINGRLANLVGWLQEAAPDIVCLQELKALVTVNSHSGLCPIGAITLSHSRVLGSGKLHLFPTIAAQRRATRSRACPAHEPLMIPHRAPSDTSGFSSTGRNPRLSDSKIP